MQQVHLLEQLLAHAAIPKELLYRRTIMFAFTARTGSTALTDAVGNMGLAKKVDEIFNRRGPVQNICKNYGDSDDIVDYVNNVFQKKMLADALLFKTDFKDLAQVLRKYDIYALFPNLQIVYIERQDKIMQAVSLYKATVTQQWHQLDHEHLQLVQQNFSPDINKIIFLKNQLEQDCAKWQAHFKLIKAQPYCVSYEDFDQNPERVLKDVYLYLENQPYHGDITLNYKKLRDQVSEDWGERTRNQLR